MCLALQLNTALCDVYRKMMPGEREAAKSLVLFTEQEEKLLLKERENLVGCHIHIDLDHQSQDKNEHKHLILFSIGERRGSPLHSDAG